MAKKKISLADAPPAIPFHFAGTTKYLERTADELGLSPLDRADAKRNGREYLRKFSDSLAQLVGQPAEIRPGMLQHIRKLHKELVFLERALGAAVDDVARGLGLEE